LRRAGWEEDAGHGSAVIFRDPTSGKRVHIHVHPHKTYGPETLKAVLDQIGWTPEEMRIFKLIK
jgi:predicted RNA binding protein YcfA (HicA-like mRNA interferase family)